MSVRFPCAAFVLSLWLHAGVATAQPRDIEQRARELLSAGVEQSATPQQLAKLGPELGAALVAIFERTSEARFVRLRALSMLRFDTSARATQLFARLLHEGIAPAATLASDPLHASRSTLVLRRAIDGLADRKVPEIEIDLTKALGHRDPQIRRAAVLALRDHPADFVQRSLATQRARETSPLVRQAFTDRSVQSPSPRSNGRESATPPR